MVVQKNYLARPPYKENKEREKLARSRVTVVRFSGVPIYNSGVFLFSQTQHPKRIAGLVLYYFSFGLLYNIDAEKPFPGTLYFYKI